MSKAKLKSHRRVPPKQIQEILFQESVRGCILAAQGHLDGMLHDLLILKLSHPSKDTDGQLALLMDISNPPFQSFFWKVVLVRALRLIDASTYEALQKLNEIRRNFAHHPIAKLSFDQVDALKNKLNARCKKEVDQFTSNQVHHATEQEEYAKSEFASIAISLMRVIDDCQRVLMKRKSKKGS
jgi:hypothetical protein